MVHFGVLLDFHFPLRQSFISPGPPPLRVPSQPSSQGDCDRDRLQIFFSLFVFPSAGRAHLSIGCAKEIEICQRNNQKKHSALPASVTNPLFTRRPRELPWWGREEEEGKSASEIFARNFSSPRINVKLVPRFIFMRHCVKDVGAGGDGFRRWRITI